MTVDASSFQWQLVIEILEVDASSFQWQFLKFCVFYQFKFEDMNTQT